MIVGRRHRCVDKAAIRGGATGHGLAPRVRRAGRLPAQEPLELPLPHRVPHPGLPQRDDPPPGIGHEIFGRVQPTPRRGQPPIPPTPPQGLPPPRSCPTTPAQPPPPRETPRRPRPAKVRTFPARPPPPPVDPAHLPRPPLHPTSRKVATFTAPGRPGVRRGPPPWLAPNGGPGAPLWSTAPRPHATIAQKGSDPVWR